MTRQPYTPPAEVGPTDEDVATFRAAYEFMGPGEESIRYGLARFADRRRLPPPPAAPARMAVRTDLIASMRSEAARSDGQVGIVLAGATAAVGFVVTATAPHGLPWPVAVVWSVGVALAVAGIAALGWSLSPAIPPGRPAPGGVFHCWHVLDAAAATGGLTDALDRTPGDLAAADRQVEALARVVDAKFRWNRTGLRLLGLALLVLAVTGIGATAAGS